MDISKVRNPYNYRHPVRDAALFAGRSGEATVIAGELDQVAVDEPSVCVVLHGQRASGKTSLLYATERMAGERGLTAVRVELIEGDGEPIAFFRKVYDELVPAVLEAAAQHGKGVAFDAAAVRRVTAGAAEASTVAPLQFPEALALTGAEPRVPEAALRHDLSFFVHLLGHPIALLVDEAQLIADDERALSILRFLTTRVEGLVLVLAGTSELIERIKDVQSPILRQFREIEVKGFVEQVDVEDCVVRPLRSAGIYGSLIPESLVSSLKRITDGNPYAIQLYCHEMFARVKSGLAPYMQLSPEVLEGIRSRMEKGDRNVLDRPLIRAVRAMSRSELVAFNVLTSALDHATQEEAWFAYCMGGQPEITREQYDHCRKSLVRDGILASDAPVRLVADTELFDEVYCRLWSARTLGSMPHTQAISRTTVRSMLINRLYCVLHEFTGGPLRIYPTCCYHMNAKHLASSFDALEKLPDAGPDAAPHVDYLHYAVLRSGEPEALDITTVTCAYQDHKVERWLFAADTDDVCLSGSADFRAAAERIAALGGRLTAERVRVPLRTWPADDWFLRATGRLRDELAVNHRTTAFAAYEAGDMDRARARFQSSFDLDPDWSAANCLMYLNLSTGHEDEALEWSRRALKLTDNAYGRVLCHYNAAMAYFIGGDPDRAAKEISVAAAELALISLQNHLIDFLLLPDPEGAPILHEETQVDLADAVERASAVLRVTDKVSFGPPEAETGVSDQWDSEPEKEAVHGLADGDAAPLGQGPVVLSVATEWASSQGGLSTFNRDLCRALAAAGARVFCVVLDASAEEMDTAREAGISLLPAPVRPGATEDMRLTSRPALPDGTAPDLVLGHGRITGPAAQKLADDFFPGARRLHVLHMAPDEIEWYKPDRSHDAGLRAENRTGIERALGRTAHRVVAVGPRLHQEFLSDFRTADGVQPLRLDPGFDSTVPDADRVPPEGGPARVLLLGRIEDAQLKGVDLAAAACGKVETRLRDAGIRRGVRLLVRGAPVTDVDAARDEIVRQAANPRLDVVVRVYTSEQDRIEDDLSTAWLVIMPSRKEGFGLTGLEAIIRGIPVLVSSTSGLGELLREKLGDEQASSFVVEVSGDAETDAETWARDIERKLRDRVGAFQQAAALRDDLARRVRWDQAAAVILGEIPRK
ncbi:glycosyltransferase [Streptomyces sp. LaBMicrA B280]|uniref:glycosyltransferase n=1 Tax=Streptomyces sp. LaBMicrA B280 TaxID=3391001 RepID=UPI003BA46BDF